MGEFDLSPGTMASVLAAVLGLGVYLMLPQGRKATLGAGHWIGSILVTVALVGLAGQFGTRLPNLTNELTFYVLAAVSVGSAVLMITSANPVYAALWFALVLLSNSGLYLLNGAEFLSAATVIVYAGAIIVTFLFVIMLAQPKGSLGYDWHSREPMLSCFTGVMLTWTLLATLHHSATFETQKLADRPAGASSAAIPDQQTVGMGLSQHPESKISPIKGHVDSLGRVLFLEHYVSVEVIGMLLFVAVVGAVLIARRNQSGAEAGLSTVSA